METTMEETRDNDDDISGNNEPTTPLLSSEPAATNYGDEDASDQDDTATSPVIETKDSVMALPWILMGLALAMFTLPWVKMAIIDRYFLKPAWQASLPGLDSTPLRKLTMQGHMSTGAVSLLIGPLQFFPWVRRKAPQVHRWTGRIYCTCAMLSCLFGLCFIALKRRLVGGYNMTIAFAFSGATIGVLGYKAWESARAAKAGGSRDFTAHRNWGIRSYSQIMAPMLYRYWYVLVEIFDLYDTPTPLRFGGYCRSDDICPEYLRLFDMVHCWTYWLTSLAIAELIIYYLPKTLELVPAVESIASETTRELTVEQPKSSSPRIVNVVGWILALTTVATTTRMFTMGGDE